MVMKHKVVLWIVIAWFAVLQTITPFIHAHLEADESKQSYGLHIHEPGLLDLPDMEHTLKMWMSPSMLWRSTKVLSKILTYCCCRCF